MNAKILRFPKRLRQHLDALTVAFVGIGARAALEAAGKAYDPDEFGGEIGLVGMVIEPHALMLDRMADEYEAGGEGLPGVFAYEVAEQFGYDYATALIGNTGETADAIAVRLFKQMQGEDGVSGT